MRVQWDCFCAKEIRANLLGAQLLHVRFVAVDAAAGFVEFDNGNWIIVWFRIGVATREIVGEAFRTEN